MSKRLLGMSAALMLCAAPAAQAGSELHSELDRAERLAREGAARFLGALEALVGSIPQYELPEVLPNGDIIIRRRPAEPESPRRPLPGSEPPEDVIGTST